MLSSKEQLAAVNTAAFAINIAPPLQPTHFEFHIETLRNAITFKLEKCRVSFVATDLPMDGWVNPFAAIILIILRFKIPTLNE